MRLRLTVDRYSEELGKYVNAFYGTKLFGYEDAMKSARYLIDDVKHSKTALAYEEWEQDLTTVANRTGKKHIHWG